jgi:transaldolase
MSRSPPEAAAMVEEGRDLAAIHDNVVVKVPVTRDGIEACSTLSRDGIRVNVTLCFSAGQALLAAKAGAYFISPFVGRLDDIGQTGVDLIRQTVAIYQQHGLATQVLAASLRGTQHVIEAALAGAHIGTMPYKVLDALFTHPLTDRGLEQFLEDYHRVFSQCPASR